jgi:hypothetical protein
MQAAWVCCGAGYNTRLCAYGHALAHLYEPCLLRVQHTLTHHGQATVLTFSDSLSLRCVGRVSSSRDWFGREERPGRHSQSVGPITLLESCNGKFNDNFAIFNVCVCGVCARESCVAMAESHVPSAHYCGVICKH